MDLERFDAATRRLHRMMTRRSGVVALVAGALGLAATDAAAGPSRRHEKLACRNANSECTSNDQCCSQRCVPKPEGGTGYRCAKRHARKKNRDDRDGNNPAPEICLPPGSQCWDANTSTVPIPCCDGYFCGLTKRNPPDMCEECLAEYSYGCFLNEANSGCCAGLECTFESDPTYGRCMPPG